MHFFQRGKGGCYVYSRMLLTHFLLCLSSFWGWRIRCFPWASRVLHGDDRALSENAELVPQSQQVRFCSDLHNLKERLDAQAL